MTNKLNIKENIDQIPEKPGVYQFYSKTGEILYIGKAKNLKKRVASYFGNAAHINYKQKVLVGKIDKIKYILVENESDALLLENNFIKEYKPRYNILLKDDKTFPWICIKKEPFSRVFYTRKVIEDGSEYFGPYTSVTMIKTLLTLIKQLYKLRTCSYILSPENIRNLKYKRCLEYHLGNCKAPCEGFQDENDYNISIQQIREILKGNLHQVMTYFQKVMLEYSKKYQYEEAHLIKQKLDILEKFRAKSTIVNPKINNVEIYSIIDEPKTAYINFMKLVKGAVVQAHNVEIIKRIDEEKEDILAYAIFDLRYRLNSNSSEIIAPFIPNLDLKRVVFTIPSRGDKKKLLDLSLRNANSYRMEKMRSLDNSKRKPFEVQALERIKLELRLKSIPDRIECVDVSNIQGREAVASCVVFKSGKPYKSQYRHYNIKSVTGANDYASIEEIVYRRCRYLKENQIDLPDLFIIDGGKGQLNAALRGTKRLGLEYRTAFIGIAKKLEEIYLPGDPLPLYIDKNSSGLKLIQRIRNEAHRFGISFHRLKRSKSMLVSELDKIKGIGNVTKRKLLLQIKDINKVKKLSLMELENITGKRAANILYDYFSTLS